MLPHKNIQKLIRFFPLNRGIIKGNIKSLIKIVGIYIVSNIVLAIAVAILDFIPLVKNLLHHVDNVYELYIWAGSLLGVFQYVTGVDTSQIEFVKLEDVLALWYNQQYKKYILIGAAVLCLVPYNGSRRISNTTQISNDMNSQDEQIVSTQQAPEMVATEISTEAFEDAISFYEYAKGNWVNDNGEYYTFDIFQGNYVLFCPNDGISFYINSSNSPMVQYNVKSFVESELEVESVIENLKNGTMYDVVFYETEMNKQMKIKEQGESDWIILSNCNITSYEEFLDKETVKLPFFDREALNQEYFSYECINYSKEDYAYAFVELTDETQGKELMLKEEGWPANEYIVLGMEDDILKPLYSFYSFLDLEVYNSTNQIFWGFYDAGNSEESSYFRYTYDEKNDWYKYISTSESVGGEKLYFAPVGESYEENFAAYKEAEEQKAFEEARRQMETSYNLDETYVLTVAPETFDGNYVCGTFPIEITLKEDMCTVKFYFESNAGTTSSVGLGNRASLDTIPEGAYVYAVSGMVRKSSGMGTKQETYAVALGLRPDGTIYIYNVAGMGATMELPEGTYVCTDIKVEE